MVCQVRKAFEFVVGYGGGQPLAKDALCCKSRYCGIGHAGAFAIDRGLKFNPDGWILLPKGIYAGLNSIGPSWKDGLAG
jgi:hypothetical protein